MATLKLMQPIALAGVIAFGFITTGCSSAEGSLGSNQPGNMINAKVLDSVGTANDPYPGDWLSYGRDQRETRYSTLKEINDTNADRLGLDWTYIAGAGGGNQEGTPLVHDGILYGITSWSVVFAVNGATGEEIWRWDPEVNQPETRPAICCGIVNRGMAIYEDMIIAPSIDGRLFALDIKTGRPIWEARDVYSQDELTLTMAPRMAGDKVIIGAAGGDHTTRGRFDAFDVHTGKHLWRFYTVPGNPADGFENEAMAKAAETWGGEWWKNGGGAAVWDGIAYDPDLNLVYVGTGNAEPWVQKFRGKKDVDNLYTCSIIAVDADTGEYKWHFQTVPNDNWDFDSVQQLMLLDLDINGQTRKVITQASKNGFFWVLDRATGEFIQGAPFVKVDWALGLDENGRPIVNPEAYYDDDPVGIEIYPTGGGAHNWSAMSFNPNTGLVYIPSSYQPFPYKAQEEYREGSSGYARPTGELRKMSSFIGPVAPEGWRGGIQAWDPVKNELAWQIEGGGGIGGGTSTTAGDLVFQVTNDGRFRAIKADDGKVLYEFDTGQRGMAPPITYEADGEQYVAFIGGMGRPAQNYGKNNATIENPVRLYAFKLGGNLELPAPIQVDESNDLQPFAKGKGKGPVAPELQ